MAEDITKTEGTTFDEDNPNPGTWFFFDDDENKGGVLLRTLDLETSRVITKKTVKKTVIYKNGGRFEVNTPNEEMQMELTWDYCIMSWKLLYIKGKLIPCNKEKKIYMMNKHLKFITLVTESLAKLANLEEVQDEDEGKN